MCDTCKPLSSGMMPKRGIDPLKNEVARFYKLHASKNLVEPVSMIVPRKVSSELGVFFVGYPITFSRNCRR